MCMGNVLYVCCMWNTYVQCGAMYARGVYGVGAWSTLCVGCV